MITREKIACKPVISRIKIVPEKGRVIGNADKIGSGVQFETLYSDGVC